MTVWNFCTLNHDQLIRYTFNIYDLDHSGEIDREEMRELVLVVFGAADVDEHAEKLMSKADSSDDIQRPCFSRSST